MSPSGATGELASARLELPSTIRNRRRAHDLRALEASIHADRDGALIVTLRAEPAAAAYTMPLLACLQFVRRIEDAAAEALTKLDADAARS